jgi:hypothetical protein
MTNVYGFKGFDEDVCVTVQNNVCGCESGNSKDRIAVRVITYLQSECAWHCSLQRTSNGCARGSSTQQHEHCVQHTSSRRANSSLPPSSGRLRTIPEPTRI